MCRSRKIPPEAAMYSSAGGGGSGGAARLRVGNREVDAVQLLQRPRVEDADPADSDHPHVELRRSHGSAYSKRLHKLLSSNATAPAPSSRERPARARGGGAAGAPS